jgi:hypothetical protein
MTDFCETISEGKHFEAQIETQHIDTYTASHMKRNHHTHSETDTHKLNTHTLTQNKAYTTHTYSITHTHTTHNRPEFE